MAGSAIDLDMLNELLDNQKQLDDIFSDDFFLDNSLSFEAYEETPIEDIFKTDSENDMPSNTDKKNFIQDSRHIFNLVAPLVLEISVISYFIVYFT